MTTLFFKKFNLGSKASYLMVRLMHHSHKKRKETFHFL